MMAYGRLLKTENWKCVEKPSIWSALRHLANTNDTLTYWSLPCLAAPPPTERTSSHPRKIFDAYCTTSYVLNSGITEPYLTKFLYVVQKWLPITMLKSKLRSSNPFGNANVTNEDRRNTYCGRIAAKIGRFNSVNSEITGQKSPNLERCSMIIDIEYLNADLRSANPLSNAKAKSKGGPTRRLRTSPIFSWLP